MKKSTPWYYNPIVIVVAVVIFLFLTLPGSAQVPGNPQTAAEGWAEFWPTAMQTILAGVSIALTIILNRVAGVLPTFITAWIDEKRKRDLHSAVMTKVAEWIEQRRWPNIGDAREIGESVFLPQGMLRELRDYANLSVPQATKWFKLAAPGAASDEILSTLATRMAVEAKTAAPSPTTAAIYPH